VGNRFAGLCEELLTTELQVEHSFYIISVSCQFVLIRVDGCKMYGDVCC